MKFRWFIPIALLIPLRLSASDAAVGAHVVTIRINPKEITVLHLRPEFESTIRMPEEVTSVILGSPGEFKAEHNEGEPEYVYVKPITKQAAQSNLLIATKSGQHVTLELVSDGIGIPNQAQPVDFLIEYRSARSFLISSDSGASTIPTAPGKIPARETNGEEADSRSAPLSNLDEEFRQQQKVNAPKWTKWADRQIETSICDMRQWSNETVISYSILNSSDQPVEIVPPQIQITGRIAAKKKQKKEGKDTYAIGDRIIVPAGARVYRRHRDQEFLRFLRTLDQQFPGKVPLHLIVDNYGTHKHDKVQDWLKLHPRFVLHFVPTSPSWLNLVERWFAELSSKAIRRGAFGSVKDLKTSIEAFLSAWNNAPQPFVWTATIESITEKLSRCRQTLETIKPGCTTPRTRRRRKIAV
jgi:transposase